MRWLAECQDLISWSTPKSGVLSLKPVLFSQRPNKNEVALRGKGREERRAGYFLWILTKIWRLWLQHNTFNTHFIIMEQVSKCIQAPRPWHTSDSLPITYTKAIPTTGLPSPSKRRGGGCLVFSCPPSAMHHEGWATEPCILKTHMPLATLPEVPVLLGICTDRGLQQAWWPPS